MKNSLFALALISLLTACKEKEAHAVTESESVTANANGKYLAGDGPLKGVELDSPKDLYCEMNVQKYGVSDTLHYKGKVYGFCSATCKDGFAKNPESYLAKK
ncbi:YHS domain-containing protein [Flavobacterium psychrotrophum]|uniref:YHS domain-containing protein n=1 Tax=Flavobacterium psychrotrophum TaxID=2294119 RepID=UPI000E30D4A3|nr:YHS domain-containing protein [Flavobacterium psychrotrophum]